MLSTLASPSVPTALLPGYRNVSLAERERVAVGLANLRQLDHACQPYRDRFWARCAELQRWPREAANRLLANEFARILPLLRRPSLPFHLGVCGWCGYLVPDCVCKDSTGEPLEYGIDLALLDWLEIAIVLTREGQLPPNYEPKYLAAGIPPKTSPNKVQKPKLMVANSPLL